MNGDVDQLLAAEQAIKDVLVELDALRVQLGSYSTARDALEHVRGSLAELASKTSLLAEKTHAATTTLATIGSPEILSRLEGLRSSVATIPLDTPAEVRSVRKIALAGLVATLASLCVSAAILAKVLLH
jgi:hypothetical protein